MRIYFLVLLLCISFMECSKSQLKLKMKMQSQLGQLFNFVSKEIDHANQKKVSNFPRFMQKSGKANHKLLNKNHKMQLKNRQDDDEESGDEPASGGLKHEGWLRLASIHFSSAEAHPPIPLGQNENGEDEEYKIDVIFGNKNNNSECADDDESDMNAIFRKNELYGTEEQKGEEVPEPDAFYFRLSDNNLYYAENDVSMVVLGAIAIDRVHSVQGSDLDFSQCFSIDNEENDQWNLCALSADEKEEWQCAMNTAIGEPCGEDDDEEGDVEEDEARFQQNSKGAMRAMKKSKQDDDEEGDDEEGDDEEGDDEEGDDEDGDDEEGDDEEGDDEEGDDEEGDDDDDSSSDDEECTKIIEQPIIMMPIPSPFCNENWNYAKKGANWNCKCSESLSQSPINLKTTEGCAVVSEKRVDFTFFDLNTCDLAFFYEDNMLKLKCGLESEEECEKVIFAKLIDLDFTEYAAREIRFHTPSEHTLDGKQFDMEVQVIFTGYTEGDIKKKAGLAFWVEMIPGSRNQFLDLIDPLMLPNFQETKVQFRSSNTNEHKSKVTISDLFRTWEDDVWPGFFSYFQYPGSLTSPPCEEYTEWFVVKQSIEFGYSGLEMIKKVLERQNPTIVGGDCSSDEEPEPIDNTLENAREIQDINKREVIFYDAIAAGCIMPEKHKEKGHFERLESVTHKYIYVDNDRPSGIDGAYVVSEEEATGGDPDNITMKEIGTTAPDYKKP